LTINIEAMALRRFQTSQNQVKMIAMTIQWFITMFGGSLGRFWTFFVGFWP
jgi:hypothetical protein